uniref:Uncharacterized protein n=1 Tax=Rousettus aegyptiacus TaxID=9407 RepID=A0A7J8BEI2_ROUAE|nr:hypothetical protein HJG63_009782 [Rousettus aegyptiacus]
MARAAPRHVSSPDSLLLFALLGWSALASARFTVVGPAGPILAMVGQNTVLHCHLSPETSAEAMEAWALSPSLKSRASRMGASGWSARLRGGTRSPTPHGGALTVRLCPPWRRLTPQTRTASSGSAWP